MGAMLEESFRSFNCSSSSPQVFDLDAISVANSEIFDLDAIFVENEIFDLDAIPAEPTEDFELEGDTKLVDFTKPRSWEKRFLNLVGKKSRKRSVRFRKHNTVRRLKSARVVKKRRKVLQRRKTAGRRLRKTRRISIACELPIWTKAHTQ